MTFSLANLLKGFHKPQWEFCAPVPVANAAGASVCSIMCPVLGINFVMFCCNATNAIYMYDPAVDGYELLPASGSSGTFAAGFAARIHPMGPSGTATAGSTTTLTTNLTLTRSLKGMYIRITGGPGAGDLRRILSNTIGANSVVTVAAADAFSATITASSTYQLITPRLYIFNPHTASTWAYFSRYDWATNTWTTGLNRPAGLAAAWGTNAALASTAGMIGNLLDNEVGKTPGTHTSTVMNFTAGAAWSVNALAGAVLVIVGGTGVGQVRTITSNTANSITVSAAFGVTPDATTKFIIEKCHVSSHGKTFSTATSTVLTLTGTNFTVNRLSNRQIRIAGGTGAGQVRSIASNTATTITVSSAWTTTPDATSIWVIEGNDDYLYLTGNNATAFYRYSISGDAWTTMTARGGAAAAGCSLTWISKRNDSGCTDEVSLLNGNYLYSFRGGAASTLDIYNIDTGAWTSAQVYGASGGELPTTGWCYDYDESNSIIVATPGSTSLPARFLRFDVVLNAIFPLGTSPVIQGTAVVGDKCFTVPVMKDGVVLQWLYHWQNSGQILVRTPLWYEY